MIWAGHAFQEAFARFKMMAGCKTTVFDEDMLRLSHDEVLPGHAQQG